MNNSSVQHNHSSSRPIAIWLLIGVGMIVIQVLLGGITRLTESGLSITEWKPVTGALPPLNDSAWQVEFNDKGGKKLATAWVNLNKAQPKKKDAKQPQLVVRHEVR